MSTYSVRTLRRNSTWRVVKWDFLLWYEKEYIVYLNRANYWHCNCEASRRPTCRHRRIVQLFQAKEKLGLGYFYDWDNQAWELPIMHPSRRFMTRRES